MRRSCLGIAGVLLASALAGCGETRPKRDRSLTRRRSIRPASSSSSKPMNDNMKTKASTTKGEEKPAPKKDAGQRCRQETGGRLRRPIRRTDTQALRGEARHGLLFTFVSPAAGWMQF